MVINGTSVGVTPLSVTVARKSGTKVLIKKDGYQEQAFVLKQKLQPWFWGNIIFGGFFGSTTDLATGATVEYSPDQYYTTLQLKESVSPEITMGVTEQSDNRIIRFILVNYNALAIDLNNKSGEYLESLLQLLKVSGDNEQEAILKLKQLFIDESEIPRFAEAVAREFTQ